MRFVSTQVPRTKVEVGPVVRVGLPTLDQRKTLPKQHEVGHQQCCPNHLESCANYLSRAICENYTYESY